MDATHFPDDLVQTLHAWNATYDALAAPHRRDITALRRRLLRLSVRLWWHPYWDTARSVPAARTELRHLARTHGAARAASRASCPRPPARGDGRCVAAVMWGGRRDAFEERPVLGWQSQLL
jgi:hypothetical protein